MKRLVCFLFVTLVSFVVFPANISAATLQNTTTTLPQIYTDTQQNLVIFDMFDIFAYNSEYILLFVAIAVIASAAVCALTIFFIVRHYKVPPETSSQIYMNNNKTQMLDKSDVFLRSHTSRVRINNNKR